MLEQKRSLAQRLLRVGSYSLANGDVLLDAHRVLARVANPSRPYDIALLVPEGWVHAINRRRHKLATASVLGLEHGQSRVGASAVLLLPQLHHVVRSKVALKLRAMMRGVDRLAHPPSEISACVPSEALPSIQPARPTIDHPALDVLTPLAAGHAKPFLAREKVHPHVKRLCFHLRPLQFEHIRQDASSPMRPPLSHYVHPFFPPRLTIKGLCLWPHLNLSLPFGALLSPTTNTCHGDVLEELAAPLPHTVRESAPQEPTS